MSAFERNRDAYLRTVREVGGGFTRPDEDWAPVMLVEGRDGRTVVGLGGGFLDSEAGKDALATIVLPALLRRESAWMFGLVLSSWLVRAREPLEVQPSEHPGRVEAVVVTVGDSARHELWTAQIVRSPGSSATTRPVEPQRRARRPIRGAAAASGLLARLS